MILEASLYILFGLIALVWSADRFISGAASIALNSGMSKLTIGLTIVAFGTSAPEIIVSMFAALDGSGGIAVGNALGSNITNIGLVLGATALIAAIPISRKVLIGELPVLFAVSLLAGFVLYDRQVDWYDSVLLFAGLGWFLFYLYRKQVNASPEEDTDEDEVDSLTGLSTSKAWMNFVIGLVVLLISAKFLVDGAVTIARVFEVPELIIGLTIVALGTSLPELAASVASALRGHHEIAFGNIIGSNIFNLLVVMAVPGLISPQPLDPSVFVRDYATMLGLTCLLAALMAFDYRRGKPFGKVAGSILLTAYVAYNVVLYIQL
ncbi:Inner membrane protein YrbG [BD1-7 clade bacterium]|uniref:Inner membrane protein YrbG n=1 Tax=BD1-7 clade bacterium TaxID=2029982 RepID=A0A5S9MVM5_9GAMM|nr:Inner membrane protein YrbG [BD1-7 clade bacterium]